MLTQAQYANLTQSETLEGSPRFCCNRDSSTKCSSFTTDLRTQLASTDYGNFLANEPSPVSTATIADKALKTLVDQFNYLRSNAIAPLDKFLDYITCVRFLHLIDRLTRFPISATHI